MKTAKEFIRSGNVGAAMALYGIEPSGSGQQHNTSISQRHIEMVHLTFGIRVMEICLRLGEPVLDDLAYAYEKAIYMLDDEIRKLDLETPGAESVLDGLQRQYGWLFDGP